MAFVVVTAGREVDDQRIISRHPGHQFGGGYFVFTWLSDPRWAPPRYFGRHFETIQAALQDCHVPAHLR